MKMKRCLPTLLWAAALLAAACRQGETPEAGEPRDVLREITVSALPQTRSVLPGDDDFESRIREVTFAVYEMGGGLVTSAHTDSTSAVLRLLAGKTYAVYALVNMGDQRARLPAVESDMSVFRYDSGPFTNFGTRGMPMAGSGYLEVGGADEPPCCIGLRRLMAKISFTVDHSALTQGVQHCGIRHASVHIRQAARALYPFMSGGSMAQNPNDIQSGEADLETIAPEHAFDLSSDTMTFYIPENAQGTLLPEGSSPWEKVPDEVGLDVARRCTYLEFLAVKDGTADGVSGDIAFRFYLGADNRRNFDVRGNQHYVVRLELTWDNLFLEGSWKVARGDDWSDGRRLAITGSGDTTVPEVVLIQPGGDASRVDLRFERGSGNRVLGARDIGYPYGWSLYIDGSAVTGNSGTLGSGTDWNYVCDAGEEYLLLSAPSSHRGGDIHILQLRTPDGQIQSASVRTQVKPPLTIETGGPLMYVGQRGILRAAHVPEGARVSWSASGSGYRFSPRDDGTALLEIIGSGNVEVTLSCAQTGQTAKAFFMGNTIYMKPDETTLYADPDGAPLPLPFSFYSTKSANNSSKLTIQSDYQETAYGRELSRVLYDEIILPAISVNIEDKTFLDLINGQICVVRFKNGSKTLPTGYSVLSTVTLTKNLKGLTVLSGSSPLTIKSQNPFRYNYPLRTPADEEDFGLVSPWMHASYSADKDIHHSTIMADPDYCGIVAQLDGEDAEPALQALFRWDGYQHTSYNLSNTTALTEHRGGLLTLHRYVINRHSLERRLSEPYAQFHLYVAGAVGGCLEDLGGGQARVKGVFAGGDYSATAFAGLSDTAFIGTERASGSSVSWSGGSASVSGTGDLKKPGEGVYTLSGNASVNWAAAQQGFLPGLTLSPVTNVLKEGNGCLTYQSYYKLYPLNLWIQ